MCVCHKGRLQQQRESLPVGCGGLQSNSWVLLFLQRPAPTARPPFTHMSPRSASLISLDSAFPFILSHGPSLPPSLPRSPPRCLSRAPVSHRHISCILEKEMNNVSVLRHSDFIKQKQSYFNKKHIIKMAKDNVDVQLKCHKNDGIIRITIASFK